jgi:hypothetical protein
MTRILRKSVPYNEKGAPNGVPELDGTGKIPASQLPITAQEWKGNWDASTNTPTLTSGVGDSGDTYRVSVAGATDLDGISDWEVGDLVIFDGTAYQKSPYAENSDQVTNLSGVTGSNVTDALNTLDSGKQANLTDGNGTVVNGTEVDLGVGAYNGADTLTDDIHIHGQNRLIRFGLKSDVDSKPISRFDTATSAGTFHVDVGVNGLLHYSGGSFDSKTFGDTTAVNLQFNPESGVTNIFSQEFMGASLYRRQIWVDNTDHTQGYTMVDQTNNVIKLETKTADPYTSTMTLSSIGVQMILQDATGIGGYTLSPSSLIFLTSSFTGIVADATKSQLLATGGTFTINGTANDTIFSDTSTNKRGILLAGFGETDVAGTGASYASLVGTSLVPKKYVDDSITAVALTNGSGTTANGTAIDLGGTLTGSAELNGGNAHSVNLGNNAANENILFLNVNAAGKFEKFLSSFDGSGTGTQTIYSLGGILEQINDVNSNEMRRDVNPTQHSTKVTAPFSNIESEHKINSAGINWRVRDTSTQYNSRLNATDEVLELISAQSLFSELMKFGMDNTTELATFTDSRGTTKGIEYAADYSAGFTARSLVDKGYVDSVAGGSDTLKVSANDTTAGYLEDKVDSTTSDGVGVVRAIQNEGANEKLQFRLGDHYLGLASTGIFTGGILSVGATTGTFDISAGEGFYIDSNTNFSDVKNNVQPVTISARTNVAVTNIATQPVTYVGIDKDDNVVQFNSFPTPQQRRDNIFLGVVVHSNNVDVNVVNNLQVTSNDAIAQIGDVMEALGFFSLSGNTITANGANLSLDKSAGTAFKRGGNYTNNKKDPHTVTLAVLNALTFRYRNQNSSEGSDATVIDPTTYDNGGTTTTVPQANDATIQRVYIFPSNIVRVQRGQEVFSDLATAVDAVGKESFVTEPNISENGLLLASIAVRKDATDLSDPSQAQIFIASRFGELGSVGSSATTTLQQAFDNSLDPEIIVPSGQAVSIQSATDGAQVIQDWKDESGVVQASINGDGNFVGNTFDGRDLSVDGTKLDTIETGAEVNAELTKGFTVFDPTATDDILVWQPGVSVNITKVVYKVIGATSVTFNISHSNTPNDLWASDQVATTTKATSTSFSDASCAANEEIRFQASAISGTPTQFEMTITYTEV